MLLYTHDLMNRKNHVHSWQEPAPNRMQARYQDEMRGQLSNGLLVGREKVHTYYASLVPNSCSRLVLIRACIHVSRSHTDEGVASVLSCH